MLDSDRIPATKRVRDTVPPPTSCKRVKFDDDVIFRQAAEDDVTPDLKAVECVSDDVISEISSSASSSSSSKKKIKNSPSNEATSRRQPSPSVTVTAPSSEEIDEFFKQAESYQHRLFVEKYNFDIVRDVPVEGRYEWVKLK